jgi:hypothetical protein
VYYKTRPVVLEEYMSELRRRMYIAAGGDSAQAADACDSGAGANHAVAATHDVE